MECARPGDVGYILTQTAEDVDSNQDLWELPGKLFPYIGSGTKDTSRSLARVQVAKADTRVAALMKALQLFGTVCTPSHRSTPRQNSRGNHRRPVDILPSTQMSQYQGQHLTGWMMV